VHPHGRPENTENGILSEGVTEGSAGTGRNPAGKEKLDTGSAGHGEDKGGELVGEGNAIKQIYEIELRHKKQQAMRRAMLLAANQEIARRKAESLHPGYSVVRIEPVGRV